MILRMELPEIGNLIGHIIDSNLLGVIIGGFLTYYASMKTVKKEIEKQDKDRLINDFLEYLSLAKMYSNYYERYKQEQEEGLNDISNELRIEINDFYPELQNYQYRVDVLLYNNKKHVFYDHHDKIAGKIQQLQAEIKNRPMMVNQILSNNTMNTLIEEALKEVSEYLKND